MDIFSLIIVIAIAIDLGIIHKTLKKQHEDISKQLAEIKEEIKKK